MMTRTPQISHIQTQEFHKVLEALVHEDNQRSEKLAKFLDKDRLYDTVRKFAFKLNKLKDDEDFADTLEETQREVSNLPVYISTGSCVPPIATKPSCFQQCNPSRGFFFAPRKISNEPPLSVKTRWLLVLFGDLDFEVNALRVFRGFANTDHTRTRKYLIS